MAGIISVGFTPVPVAEVAVRVPAIGAPLERDDLERLVDEVRAAVDGHGSALVVYPSWLPEPTLVRLQTVRTALDTTNVAFHASPAPPLVGGVLVALAAALEHRLLSEGALLAALPIVGRWLVSVTWLARAPGRCHPALAACPPTPGQRLAGFWPSTAFAVCSWPRPTLHALTRQRQRVPLPALPPGIGLVIAARDADIAWMHAAVVAPLASPPSSQVDASPLGPAYWGQRRLVEAVAYPLSLDSAVQALAGRVGADSCRWCARPSPGGTCAFCRAPDEQALPGEGGAQRNSWARIGTGART